MSNRRRLRVIRDILVCCSSGAVSQAAITRRCNLNSKSFHYFVEPLVEQGFLSQFTLKASKKQKINLYAVSTAGLDFLRGINTLQSQTVQLQKTFGELI